LIDSVQTTNEWPAAIAKAGHEQHVILAAGQVLFKLAAAAMPVVVILTVGVLAMAAFVGGFLATMQ
jgi:hypothetical protein